MCCGTLTLSFAPFSFTHTCATTTATCKCLWKGDVIYGLVHSARWLASSRCSLAAQSPGVFHRKYQLIAAGDNSTQWGNHLITREKKNRVLSKSFVPTCALVELRKWVRKNTLITTHRHQHYVQMYFFDHILYDNSNDVYFPTVFTNTTYVNK